MPSDHEFHHAAKPMEFMQGGHDAAPTQMPMEGHNSDGGTMAPVHMSWTASLEPGSEKLNPNNDARMPH